VVTFDKGRQIRHNRILDLRKKIQNKWTLEQLHKFCKINLGVTKATAVSYINEAAEPYRIKYQKEQNKIG